MDLKNAKLGEQYRIFLTSEGRVSETPTMRTVLATVIATKKPSAGTGLILGWKKDEEHPVEAAARNGPSAENDYVPNQALYVYGKSVYRSQVVAIQIHAGVDGFPCHKCLTFYPYAVPNRSDGTLLCYSCRTKW